MPADFFCAVMEQMSVRVLLIEVHKFKLDLKLSNIEVFL